jgi:exodeoxyribonuclease V beta subunit
MTLTQLPTFDLLGPLPRGTTMLEASAGTGKTYTVGALVARYVAEGVATLDEMLVITFGRAASQELRERVREQLVDVSRRLADPGAARASGIELVAHLATGDDDVVEQRRLRVVDALASFDAATIATTHQFCQIVLRSLGVAGDTDARARLVEDLDDLVVEVVDDVYLARYAGLDRVPFARGEALRLARVVTQDPQAVLTPSDPAPGSSAQARVEFAQAVRAELDRRKQRLGVLSFDDLLGRLATALEDEDAPARERMRRRWRIVLVDEFQDTDPVQWQVLQRAFDGHSTLVLIGDPKQAIYAFRGGDIDSYLHAAGSAGDRQTLGTNHRSDAPLVDALQVLTRGAALGDPSIVVHPVDAAHRRSRLTGAPAPDPVRLRLVTPPDGAGMGIGDARTRIAVDLADDVARLLSSGAQFDDGSGPRPVQAGDVAVLMFSLSQAGPIADALADRGVPSVRGGRGSVLTSPAADHWLTALEALDRQSPSRVRSLALTPFLGVSPVELDTGGDPLTDRLSEQVRDWLDLFRSRGIAAVHEAAVAAGLAERVIGRPDGERLLTDLDHVAEVLHDVAQRDRLGLAALLEWLREERRDAAASTERTRRLDTDAAAVQLVTIHSSKGLQYPIVHLPHLFNRWLPDEAEAYRYHQAGERMLDVGRPRFDDPVVQTSLAEDAAEELRLTYVALTRAQSQVVAWWAPTRDSANSGLTRLLLGRRRGEAVVPDRAPTLAPEDALSRLRAWQDHGGLVLESAESQRHDAPRAPADDAELLARRLERVVDTEWRRTSYTGLLRVEERTGTSAPHSEPEDPGTVDEDPAVDDEPPAHLAAPVVESVPSPMADLPAGAGFGSLVHAVLEHADPHAPDLAAELLDVVGEHLRWWPVPAGAEEIAAALLPLHETPLGPLVADLTLRDIGLADRLRELDFELPLAGGDRPAAHVVAGYLSGFADVMRRHLPAGDLLAPYAERLASGPVGEQQLRGYLSGSIDVVLRVPDADGHRFVVVDYKTNRLGTLDQPLTAQDYTPQHMAESMMHSHYPLQAMLYSVVLHRYLRWRLPGYEPERHLGGVQYHYVRGMCGPSTPVVDAMTCGVFAWRPPAAMVVELSDLMAGEVAR